jgi:hypothetical protein
MRQKFKNYATCQNCVTFEELMPLLCDLFYNNYVFLYVLVKVKWSQAWNEFQGIL